MKTGAAQCFFHPMYDVSMPYNRHLARVIVYVFIIMFAIVGGRVMYRAPQRSIFRGMAISYYCSMKQKYPEPVNVSWVTQ